MHIVETVVGDKYSPQLIFLVRRIVDTCNVSLYASKPVLTTDFQELKNTGPWFLPCICLQSVHVFLNVCACVSVCLVER